MTVDADRDALDRSYLDAMNRLYKEAVVNFQLNATMGHDRHITIEELQKDGPCVRALMFATILEATLWTCLQSHPDKELWADIIQAAMDKVFRCLKTEGEVADVDDQLMKEIQQRDETGG